MIFAGNKLWTGTQVAWSCSSASPPLRGPEGLNRPLWPVQGRASGLRLDGGGIFWSLRMSPVSFGVWNPNGEAQAEPEGPTAACCVSVAGPRGLRAACGGEEPARRA